MTPEREREIRDALMSGNENAGRLRLEAMASELLDALDAEREAGLQHRRALAKAAAEMPVMSQYYNGQDMIGEPDDGPVDLLRRIVKYAREDGAATPGSTRLARALADAQAFLADAALSRIGGSK